MKNILDGVIVLDLTRFFSGPQCTLFLAAMGAEVIKIDDPKGGDPTTFAPPYDGPDGISFERRGPQDMGLNYLKRQRGKKSVTLDLKKEEGRRIFLEMAKKAHVVVENFRPGVADRLKISYDVLKAVNPSLVYCALTGYGSTGPSKDDKAYDLMVQAAVGLMALSGAQDGPPAKAASALADAISGVFAAHGIVAALLHRERTGEGQAVDVAMTDSLFSLLFDEPIDVYGRLGLAERQGNRIMRFSPFNTFKAKDGWVTIGTATHDEWLALLDAMGRAELKADANMMSVGWRIQNNGAVDAVVTQWTERNTKAEIVAALAKAGVACSPVRSIDEVMEWDQLKAREMIVPLVNPLTGKPAAAKGPGFPIKFSRTPAGYATPSPLPGAHCDEVFGRLANLTPEEVRRRKVDGII